MTAHSSLWTTENRSRWFLLPDDVNAAHGSLSIRSLQGQTLDVDSEWIAPFEVTEDQARRLAKDQLGQALGELKEGIDEKLSEWRGQLADVNKAPVAADTTVTPNAASVLVQLFQELPGVLGRSLSGDEQRVETARTTMLDLQRRLKEAGIELDGRFAAFPDRIAGLRKTPDCESR